MFTKFRSTYPNAFKVLVLATFIDRLGSFILYPFFALYITEHFGVGIIEVGLLFSIFSAGDLTGGMIGGALTDKYGRRAIIIFGLIVSGIGSILMGLVNILIIFYILALFLGLIGNIGNPARQAMVVDLLPPEKQAEGFGMIRVALNLSAIIGPVLGGLLATQSFMILFIIDAMSSLITAIIVYVVIPETKPPVQKTKSEETLINTIVGYKEVLKDKIFLIFLLISAITVLVYMQMNSTLSIFLRDAHGFSKFSFSLLLSMNALIVVLTQFWISKKIAKYTPMKMMAFGTLFLMIGFGMYGFIFEPYLSFIAMVFITVGEMIVFPVGQGLVAKFAPEDKRGRYMAVASFQWSIPNLFGVLVAALVMEYIGPNWVWYFAGILSLIAMIGFWLLHGATRDRLSRELEPANVTLTEQEIVH